MPSFVFGLGADQLVMSCNWQYLWFNGGRGGILHLVCTALCYGYEEQGRFVGRAVVRWLVSLCVYALWKQCNHQFLELMVPGGPDMPAMPTVPG